jgi:hypothetical protein
LKPAEEAAVLPKWWDSSHKRVHADIRFTGGATRLVEIPLPKTCIELRATDASLVREIDALLDMYTDAEIADLLNERGGPHRHHAAIHTHHRGPLTHRLRPHEPSHASPQGWSLTPEAIARKYGLKVSTVHEWRRRACSAPTRSMTRASTCTKFRPPICPSSLPGRAPITYRHGPPHVTHEVQYEPLALFLRRARLRRQGRELQCAANAR